MISLFLSSIFSHRLSGMRPWTSALPAGSAGKKETRPGHRWTPLRPSTCRNVSVSTSGNAYCLAERKKKNIYKAIRITWSAGAQWNIRYNNLLHSDPLMYGQWLPLSLYSDSAHTLVLLTRLPTQWVYSCCLTKAQDSLKYSASN